MIIYGTVGSCWERRNGKTVYTIPVPANWTAQISRPSGTAKAAGTDIHTVEEELA
ncbi:MAG: hypothetical protein K2M15_08365 [Oscillospiraceae bacterium]|nr:hypothetical protein [Oscillospiraceae bacterium]MDE7172221.1 hypothetical protein [Oscillospiraceae bacterium]